MNGANYFCFRRSKFENASAEKVSVRFRTGISCCHSGILSEKRALKKFFFTSFRVETWYSITVNYRLPHLLCWLTVLLNLALVNYVKHQYV